MVKGCDGSWRCRVPCQLLFGEEANNFASWLDKCAHCGYDAFVHRGPSGRKVRAEELLDGCAPSEGDGTPVVWQRQAGVESETRLQVCWRCGLPTPTFVRRGAVN